MKEYEENSCDYDIIRNAMSIHNEFGNWQCDYYYYVYNISGNMIEFLWNFSDKALKDLSNHFLINYDKTLNFLFHEFREKYFSEKIIAYYLNKKNKDNFTFDSFLPKKNTHEILEDYDDIILRCRIKILEDTFTNFGQKLSWG
jgi:hypothetical protein